MASPLIFIHRQRNPNGFVKSKVSKSSISTSQWAHKYVLYMARREGVVKHEDVNHGLFGKLENNDNGNFGIIKNIAGTAEYVKNKVKNGTCLYDNIVSISKDDFGRLGYDDSPDGIKAWQQLVKDNVNKMADKIGIPASRVEYISALHIEDGKPNLHLLFWDSKQGIKPYYKYKKAASEMRGNLTKYVYADDLKELSETKTSARNFIIETAKVLNRNIPTSYLDAIRAKIVNLMEKLPKTGRLSYDFLPADLKVEVMQIAKDIIKDIASENPDFKAEFETYKKAARDMAKLYSTDIAAHDKAEEKAEEDLTKRLVNQLLKSIKDINRSYYIKGREDFGTQKNQTMHRNMTMQLLASLFRCARDENRKPHSKHFIGKTDRIEARRDAQQKHSSASGLNWGDNSL